MHSLNMPGGMQRLPALSAHVGRGAAQEAIQGGLLGASARQRLEAMPGALRQGYATSDLAARVAAVAAAHELAKLAGRVPGGAPALPDDRAAAGEAAASVPLPGIYDQCSSTYAFLRLAQSAKVSLLLSMSVRRPAQKPWCRMLLHTTGHPTIASPSSMSMTYNKSQARRCRSMGGCADELGAALWAGVKAVALSVAPGPTQRYLVAGREQRVRVRAFQALVVLAPFAPDEDVEPTLGALWRCLEVRLHNACDDGDGRLTCNVRAHVQTRASCEGSACAHDQPRTCAQADAAPSVRQFEEAVCLALLLRRPDLATGFLLPRMDPCRPRVEGQSSLALVGTQLLIHAPADHAALLAPFFAALLPWAMHHNHTLRCATPLAGCSQPGSWKNRSATSAKLREKKVMGRSMQDIQACARASVLALQLRHDSLGISADTTNMQTCTCLHGPRLKADIRICAGARASWPQTRCCNASQS